MADIYRFTVKTHDHGTKSLADYEGRVLLVVNTASQCGYTPQYEGLQKLYGELEGKGLQVLAFPCNQFGKQEPGDDETIQQFCQVNYHVGFPVFSKIDVNGPGADPLYQYLTKLDPPGDIKWNFTKFLFDRQGNYLGRFESAVTPEALRKPVEEALG